MTKLRVHELAKELGMENKDLMEILEKKNVEAKTSMSSIPDEVVAELRSGHAGKGTSEDAPKKKNIVQVFRPQNSKSGNRRPGGSRSGNGQNTQGTSRQDRPAGGRNGQRPASGQNGSRQDRPARGPQANGERENRRPQEGRPAGNRRPEEGQRGGFRQNRPADGRNGQRPSSAPNGQRGNRRQDEGARNGQRPDSRRNDRNDRNDRNSIPSPLVEQQKPQRNKAKDKEKDYKKKENREEGFESKGKKGRKQKPTVEVQRPQPKPEVKKEEEIKQITIPEVLTIQELADKMKVVPSVIVKKLFMQGKIVTVNQEIDFETAEEIAMEFEILCEKEEVVDVIEELLKEDEEDEEDEQTLEFSCEYDKKYVDQTVEFLLKDKETEDEQTSEFSYKDEEDEQTQEFSYKDEETEEEQAQELDAFADEIKDIFHQNSYGMMNIENNYMEAMLSETFRYKDIDKNIRLSVRVKDAFIKYNRDKWLEKFNDVNTEWINECICLGEFFENIMKEMSEYLEQICEKEDIIAWSRNVVEECKKEDDINKFSEHLYGIWNSVYNYAIDNKIAITKVRNEYFEKYFSSLKNERRQEELL